MRDAGDIAAAGDVDTLEDAVRTRDALRPAGRSLLGIVGRSEYGPMRDALAATNVSWYPLTALALLAAVDAAALSAPSLLDSNIARTLGHGPGNQGVVRCIVALLFVGPVLAAARRAPSRAQLALGASGIAALALLAASTAGSSGVSFLVLVTAAAAMAAAATQRPLLMDTYSPEVRVRAFCLHSGAAVVGMGAAAFVAAVAGGVDLTWRATLLVLGLAGAGAVAAAGRLREPGRGGWDSEPLTALVRQRSGGIGDRAPALDTEQVRLTQLARLRRVLTPAAARPLLLLAATFGMLAIALPPYVMAFLRDRWELAHGSRLLAYAVACFGAVAGLVVFARRGEVAFRLSGARFLHLSAWTTGLGAVAVAVAVVVPSLPLSVVALSVAFACLAAALPAAGLGLLTITDPEHRAEASVLVGVAIAVGGVGSDLVLRSIGSRFGVLWALHAAAAIALVVASRVSRAVPNVDRDVDGTLDRAVEHEELRTFVSQGRHLPLLACRGIDFSYGQLQVLFDVDFTVDDGEMVALLGTNGAGKSTLLRVISGLGVPSRGSVTFRGADVTFLDSDRRVQLGVTQIPGGKAVFGPLSVVDNLRAYGYTLGRSRGPVDAGIDATFSLFPRLDERRNQLAATLSGGEQQMLALGKALMLSPRVLLIDELSLGLAPIVVGELLAMVQRINASGTAVVLVEQSVNIALSLVDHAYFMERGQIRFDGKAADLVARPDLVRSVFLAGAAGALRGDQ